MHYRYVVAALALLLVAAGAIACGSSGDPNLGRVLLSVSVTPATADGHSNPSGVVFTATGRFNLPPFSAPLTFTAPYAGQFVVDNPTGMTIATVISSGTGTVTVQCAAGVTQSVLVTASASSNSPTTGLISASGTLTCP